MSVKVKVKLKVLAFMEAGFKLVDASGDNPQVIKKTLLMSASEDGITSDTEIVASIGLNTEQIADLVHQNNAGRKLVVLLELDE